MNNDIIVLKQLPIIEERLKAIAESAKSKIETALSLQCTEDTVQEVKKVRTELRKEFEEIEAQRIAVKKALMQPYDEAFMPIYKEYVDSLYTNADEQLKDKIDAVTEELRLIKQDEVQAFFREYAQSLNLDFITFERSGIKVNLSSSVPKIKKEVEALLDGIKNDIEFIREQPDATEVLVEYRNCLSALKAISIVQNRKKQVEAEEEYQQKLSKLAEQEAEIIGKVDDAVEITPPIETPIEQIEEELTVSFTVTATRAKLKQLKAFLAEGDFKYE